MVLRVRKDARVLLEKDFKVVMEILDPLVFKDSLDLKVV